MCAFEIHLCPLSTLRNVTSLPSTRRLPECSSRRAALLSRTACWQGSEDYLMPLKHLERFSYNLPSFSVSYHIKEISNKKKYSVSKVASCYPLKGYQGGWGSAICSSVVSDNSSLETVYKKAKGSVHSWPPW